MTASFYSCEGKNMSHYTLSLSHLCCGNAKDKNISYYKLPNFSVHKISRPRIEENSCPETPGINLHSTQILSSRYGECTYSLSSVSAIFIKPLEMCYEVVYHIGQK